MAKVALISGDREFGNSISPLLKKTGTKSRS